MQRAFRNLSYSLVGAAPDSDTAGRHPLPPGALRPALMISRNVSPQVIQRLD